MEPGTHQATRVQVQILGLNWPLFVQADHPAPAAVFREFSNLRAEVVATVASESPSPPRKSNKK